jgi:hypothetical protein
LLYLYDINQRVVKALADAGFAAKA